MSWRTARPRHVEAVYSMRWCTSRLADGSNCVVVPLLPVVTVTADLKHFHAAATCGGSGFFGNLILSWRWSLIAKSPSASLCSRVLWH